MNGYLKSALKSLKADNLVNQSNAIENAIKDKQPIFYF